jgi:hypothetical protein
MSRIIVIDTIFNTIVYENITNDTNLQYIIKSSYIGYYVIKFKYKPYYYIIWCDNMYSNIKISPVVKYYLPILENNYETMNGIYLITKYDSTTHNILDIDDTLENIRMDIIGIKND